ncbi:AraC family transcriptional regulator [Tistrella mobilis]|uniref:helix-turn-helix transcriptional regulator n=1 Tax=Tistrella mobilis TaxID=171437 RepID=UPI00355638B4
MIKSPDPSAEIPVSRLIAGSDPATAAPAWQVTLLRLQDGVELVHWCGRFERPTSFALHDDSDRIHFSFTSRLDGAARCSFPADRRDHAIRAETGCISFGRGRHGSYHQQGMLENVTVMVRPDIFAAWAGEGACGLIGLLATEGGFLADHRGRELTDTARGLARALRLAGEMPSAARHPLWYRAQGTALVGLFLEARRQEHLLPAAAAPADRARLRRARDILLADLSCAPSLADLARTAGLSVTRLERGFHALFGTSVYGLFQQERMAEARRRLLDGEVSVTRIAADLGYTNTSHFAAAFRKQHGINPSALKRRR